MKKIVVTCALLSFATLSVFAQTTKNTPVPAPNTSGAPGFGPTSRPSDGLTPEQRKIAFVENQARAFERQYGLTEKQYKGIYSACLDYITEQYALEDKKSQLTNEDYDKLMAKKDAKFKKIMNAAQYAKYESTRTRPVPQPGSPVGSRK